MKEKLAKLKNSSKNLRSYSSRGKFGIFLLFIILVLLVVSGIIAYVENRKTTQEKPSVACDQLTQESQKIFQSSARTPEEVKSEYDRLEQSNNVCGNKAAKNKSDLELLKYNRSMAITSYSFGSADKAKAYASTALELNEKIDDNARQEFASKEVVKTEMEAINNGNY